MTTVCQSRDFSLLFDLRIRSRSDISSSIDTRVSMVQGAVIDLDLTIDEGMLDDVDEHKWLEIYR